MAILQDRVFLPKTCATLVTSRGLALELLITAGYICCQRRGVWWVFLSGFACGTFYPLTAGLSD